MSSSSSNSTISTDVKVNIVFGALATLIGVFTIYHGFNTWKLLRVHDDNQEGLSKPQLNILRSQADTLSTDIESGRTPTDTSLTSDTARATDV